MDVRGAVQVEVLREDSEAEQVERRLTETRRGRNVFEQHPGLMARVAVQRVRLHVEVRHAQVRVAVPIEVGQRQAHARFGPALPVHRGAREQGQVLERAVAPVPEQQVQRQVVRHIQVRPAVRVQIGEQHAEPLAVGIAETGGFRRVLEGAAAAVRVVPVALAEEERRVADLRFGIRPVPAAVQAVIRVVVEIAADVEIEVAVAVAVGKRHRGTPGKLLLRRASARAFRGCSPRAASRTARRPARRRASRSTSRPARRQRLRRGEPARAAVAQEDGRAVVRHEQVDVPVPVDVGGDDALSVAPGQFAGRGPLEAEPPAAVRPQVAEQPVRRLFADPRRERPRLHQVEVQPAVAVEIDPGRAGAHRLRQVEAAAGPRVVDEADAGLGRDLRESETAVLAAGRAQGKEEGARRHGNPRDRQGNDGAQAQPPTTTLPPDWGVRAASRQPSATTTPPQVPERRP